MTGEICNTGSSSKVKDKKILDLFQGDRKKYEKIRQAIHKEEMYEACYYMFKELLEQRSDF